MRRPSLRRDFQNLLALSSCAPRATKLRLVLGISCVAVQAALLVASARVLGTLLEVGLAEQVFSRVPAWLAITVVLQGLSLIFLVLGRQALARGAWEVIHAIRGKLLDKVPLLSFRTLDRARPGDIVGTISSELDALDARLRDALVRLGQTAIHLLFILLTAFALSPPLAFLLVAGLVPAWILSAWFRKHLREAQFIYGETEANVHAVVGELAGGGDTLLGVHALPWARARLGSAQASAYRDGLALARWEALSSGVLSSVCYLPLVLVAATALMVSGSTGYSLALVITFIRLGQQIVFPVQALALETQGLQAVFRSTDRILAFLQLGEEPDATGAEIRPLADDIRFECVSLTYGGRETLRSVSLTARLGEIVGIEGPSGSGKSTLLGALLRLYPYQSGEILWDGVSIKHFSFRSLRRAIAYGFGDPLILEASLRENLAMGQEVDVDKLHRLALLCGLDRLQSGGKIRLDDPVKPATLSPGERQKIQLVRLALSPASVIVLDEALSALDPEVERSLLARVGDLFPGKTVFLVNHRPGGLDGCDRVFALGDGKLRENALSRPPEIGIPAFSE